MTELKCPKCKETEEIYYVFDSIEKGHGIKCYKCGYEVVGCKSIEEAEFKWRSKNDPKALKPCPFCGSFARLTGKWCKKYWVRCAYDKCNASVYADTEEKAIEYWNRRAKE